MQKTYSIPKMKIELFQKRISKMSRKAEKLGLKGLTIEYLEEYVVSIESKAIKDYVHHIPYVKVVVGGEAPQIDGYRLVAMLERLNGENIVKRFSTGTEDESNISFEELAYRTTECDHCKSNRARKYVMVLQDVDSNELIQVGKACLKDYTNSNYSAEQIANYFAEIDMVHELEDVSEEEISSGGHYLSLFNLDKILAISIELTETEGYKPSSYALSTKEETWNFIFKKHLVPYNEMPSAKELIEKHADKIQSIKEFFITNEATNDYTHNLKVILKSERIEYKQLGYTVSAYSSYQKAMGKLGVNWESVKREREAEKQSYLQSEYVGEVGHRTSFELVADRVITYEGAYGVGYMYFFKDSDGNVFLWGTNKDLDLEQDQKVSIVGTIKEHKEYRDVKQTVITRCKIS